MSPLRQLRHLATPLLCGVIALSLLAIPAAATTSVLGHNGTVYTVLAGSYGDLFPQSSNLDASDPVLALEVQRSDGTSQRLLVPATAGAAPDTSPALIYEDASETVYLVWASRINIHPVFYLASYDGSSWSDTVEITGNPFAMKGAPSLAITRDTFTSAASDGTTTTHDRTILHIVWKEETTTPDIYAAFYTPVVIEDGIYTGHNAVYRLDDLVASDAPADQPLSGALGQTITVRNGAVDGEVIIGFADSTTRRLISVGIDVVPHDLVSLADGARAHIIVTGVKYTPSEIKSLAADARAHIITTGVRLHPGTVRLIADDVASYIEEHASDLGSSDGLSSLAEGARAHIIVTGARYTGSDGLRNVIAQSQTTVVSADPQDTQDSGYVALRVVSDRALPPLEAGAPALFLSPDGASALLSWTDSAKVLYRERRDQGDWSDLQTLRLGPSLSASQAANLLAARVGER